MERRNLETHADRIEMVLASHRVPSQVRGGTLTPQSVRFFLTPELGVRLSRIKALSEEIALALGAPSCRISRHQGTIAIDVPRRERTSTDLMPLFRRLGSIPTCCPMLGVDEQGTPVLVRLSSPEVAHVLIAGTTGCGKTELARSMVASLAMHNRLSDLQILLIDPKCRGFGPFSGLPHLLRPILSDALEIEAQLLGLVREMERRDSEGINRPRIVIFVDELADLILKGQDPMQQAVARLVQRGRSAGMHIVACTQKPTAAVIGSLVKANFPVRLVGRVTSAEDARVAAGLPGTGAERLSGRGDFLLVASGEVTRIQAAYAGESVIRGVVHSLTAAHRNDVKRDHSSKPALTGVAAQRPSSRGGVSLQKYTHIERPEL